jgi:1-acyl-sn-glycerol-3-phosphate acyltransferase
MPIQLKIPHPELQSYMHTRIPVPKKTLQEKIDVYNQERGFLRLLEAISSRIFRIFYKIMPNSFWSLYRIVMGFQWFRFRLTNRIEVHGLEKIPKSGAILIINHIGSKDVIMVLSMFRLALSVFTDVGDSWYADFLEERCGFIPRRGTAEIMVEQMIQSLLTKNRFLAMFPEGSPSLDQQVMEGYSGIIKVYATVNSLKDRIPFVPIMLRGAEGYWSWGKGKYKVKRNPFTKTIIDVFNPVYLPRTWLLPPDQGGKTPRDMINWLMMQLAKRKGQKELAPNPALNRRRQVTERTWHHPRLKK